MSEINDFLKECPYQDHSMDPNPRILYLFENVVFCYYINSDKVAARHIRSVNWVD